MKESKIVVNNKVGLHARPASLFVQAATKFKSDINVYCQDPETKEDRNANAKSILGEQTGISDLYQCLVKLGCPLSLSLFFSKILFN